MKKTKTKGHTALGALHDSAGFTHSKNGGGAYIMPKEEEIAHQKANGYKIEHTPEGTFIVPTGLA